MVSVLNARITGSHYNPALTVAIYTIEKKWHENLPIAITFIVA